MNALAWLTRKFGRAAKGEFVRAVGLLAGGTVLAQALMVLSLPALTRIYEPSEFGLLAVYMSTLAIISVVACLRLEIAIPLPEDDADAFILLGIALRSATFVALSLTVVVVWIPQRVSGWLGQPAIAPYLWLLPIGVLLSSYYSALQYWASRKKQFARIAKTRVTQSLAGVGAQVSLGLAGVGPFGLLLGHLLNGGAGTLNLGRQTWNDARKGPDTWSWPKARRIFLEYRRFPYYSVPEALLINGGSQLPILLLAGIAGGTEVGYLLLASRITSMPMALIGSAVGQVYLAHAADHSRAGSLGRFTVATVNKLMVVGVGPLIFMGIIAPVLAHYVLGSGWDRAGQIIFWMIPMVVLQFLSSPISMAMHVLGKQREMLIVVALGFCLRIGAILMSARLGWDPVLTYIWGATLFYMVLNLTVWRYAGCGQSETKVSNLALMVPLGWLTAAVIIRWVFWTF